MDTALEACGRRRGAVIGIGALAAGLLAAAGGVAVLWPEEETAAKPRAHAAARPATPSPTPPTAAVPPAAGDVDPDAMPEAAAYFRVKDPDGKVARHVVEVRRSGEFLRVYTDLDEEENAEAAIALCEWAVEYLERYDGGDEPIVPIVFVHAKESDNGHVVLANKQSADDDCRV